MRFVKDSASKSYDRAVFNFMEVTGNIGGLFEILGIAGGIFVGLFSGRVFLFSILPKLYHIEDPRIGDRKSFFPVLEKHTNIPIVNDLKPNETNKAISRREIHVSPPQ